jgi:hypothetical protein
VDDFLSILRTIIWSMFCACVLWLSINVTQAQTLTLNATQSGELAAGASDSWEFVAQEGQLLSFLATSDALDAMLAIANRDNAILIANDDYSYPDSRDALIEAFSAPYTGTYTLTVSGYGESSGAYELLMSSGYSEIAVQNTFDSSIGWQGVDVGSETLPQLEITNGALSITQEGINQRAVIVGVRPETDVYYVQAQFSDISSAEGWRVGLVMRYIDSLNYYAVFLNQNGAWRLLQITDGEETILRDWGTHPAIRPGVTEFSLSVLVNAGASDIFYNEQFVGTVVDETEATGQVGFALHTMNALGSVVTARIDALTLTVPTQINEQAVFPDTLVALNSNYTARELERRLVIPSGGALTLNIAESFAQQVEAGISRFPVARDMQFGNFVLGATVSWQAADTALNGCGLTVRDTDDNYVLAYVDSGGGYGLSLREGDTFTENIFHENVANQPTSHQLLLIARDNTVHFYLNRQFVGTLNTDITAAGIGEAVVNFESTNTECQFTNLWVWTWD